MRLAQLAPNLRRNLGLILFAGTILSAPSCTAIDQPLRSDLEVGSADVQECAGWFKKLDEAVDGAGVRDAEAYRISGFPYLRVDRFLASFRQQVQLDSAVFAAWESRLRELDQRARGYELKNLPPHLLTSLGVKSLSEATARTDQCATVLARLDESTASRRSMLVERAQVPDDYADWKRVVGLYPVVSVLFFEFAKGWQDEAAATFQRTAAGTVAQKDLVRYQPPGNAASAARISSIIAEAKTDSLDIPLFGERESETLFATFAPVFEIETTGRYDRFGPLGWSTGETPEVDVSRPTVYRRLAFTRYGERTLVQLIYMLWFPERPQSGSLDLLSGKLDGIVFRVTLDRSGHPLVYDSIHLCGCYHMFFPTPRVRPIPAPDPQVEWAFVPLRLPAIEAPQRILVRVASRSHYLTDVRPDTGSRGAIYAMADDTELRALPTADGTRSAFGADGIVSGTDRGERLFTWPLGIEDAGAMREWGRHATALVGRRQFDDAHLIEQRFEILPSAAVSSRPQASTN